MVSGLIDHIAQLINSYDEDLFLIRNPDGILSRADIKNQLSNSGIRVFDKEGMYLRVDFELNFKKDRQTTIYLIDNANLVLEDIRSEAVILDFHLSELLPEFHLETLIRLDIVKLDYLLNNRPLLKQSKTETLALVNSIFAQDISYNIQEFLLQLEEIKGALPVDWMECIRCISKAIIDSIGTPQYRECLKEINVLNQHLQGRLIDSYKEAISASYIKRPAIVSSILNFLSRSEDDKLCLIVVDGMAYWQYLMLREKFDTSLQIEDNFTFSWLPSITQLSRQAIFRGDIPIIDFRHGPENEIKLWVDFWTKKGKLKPELRYDYNTLEFAKLNGTTRFALVLKDLDEKMHGSTDYLDLKALTQNWIEKSGLALKIKELAAMGYRIYLTTDHGNIPSRGWRRLNQKEKLGANITGSRSARHIVYSNKELADAFIKLNHEIEYYINQDNNILYLNNDMSFKNESELVTHGGSHLLEMIIPFIKIKGS